MLEYLKGQLDYIFFFYGLSFIFLGFTARSFLKSNYLPHIPWFYLSLFGFIHGLNEWCDMFAIAKTDSDSFRFWRFLLAALSFVALFEFGFKGLLRGTYLEKKLKKTTYLITYSLLSFPLFLSLFYLPSPYAFAIASRTGFGFLGAILSSFLFYKMRHLFQGRLFMILALVFFVYGLITIMGPKSDFLLASFINQDLFSYLFQIPIQLLRGIIALLSSIFIFIIYESYLVRNYGGLHSFKKNEAKIVSYLKDPRFFVPISVLLLIALGAYWVNTVSFSDFTQMQETMFIKEKRFDIITILLLFILLLSYFFFSWHVERKNNLLEQQMFQTGKLAALGTLSAGITHEINNPLTVILGTTELLVSQLKDLVAGKIEAQKNLTPEKILKQLEKNLMACIRMKSIVDHMREFSRNASKEKLSNYSLNNVVEDALLFVRKQIEASKVQIVLKLDPKLPNMMMNKVKMESVVQNLLQNAKDAFDTIHDERKKEIEVQSYFDSQYYYLRVKDNASGISEENQEKVFHAFFTTKEVGKGTGLGLALVSGIVGEHNGEIELQSR